MLLMSVIMLIVTIKSIMLNAIKLSVVMLNVVMLNVVTPPPYTMKRSRSLPNKLPFFSSWNKFFSEFTNNAEWPILKSKHLIMLFRSQLLYRVSYHCYEVIKTLLVWFFTMAIRIKCEFRKFKSCYVEVKQSAK
jgi:hypothetical protein